ncbi:hypothetical protein PybrP1_005807 [[Pythium] brassicae (nom. inval.)]|nr:hypothetical protein PybrP1_005807 [[Pythium] brassicae (nom. inval.)]
MATPSSASRRLRQVLLYGTSANPPTGLQGHMGAVAYCRQFVDEVWLLPVYQHIYSSKRALAPFHHRVRMCELAASVLPASGARVEVKESERELFEHLAAATGRPEELRVGSIDLIKFLLERNPDTAFTMLLGADTYADLLAGKWKRGEELQHLVQFLVMDRQGVDSPWHEHEQQQQQHQSDETAVERDQREAPSVRFITVPGLSDVSSTRVRATSDIETLRELVGEDVAAYIVEHKLYAFTE